jgi:enoyl-CoA hydratase/carnithine racemase
MGETVDVKRHGAIATVVMHRGGNNAIAPDLVDELEAAFKELGSDESVRCIVLASEYEKYFSVGADLTAMAGRVDREAPDALEKMTAMIERMDVQFSSIEACPKPVVAAINGHALGGGCELTLCCDYRIMVEDGRSRIGQSETALGIMPGAGGTQRLPRLIGKSRALPLLLEATRLSAKEAEAIVLVTKAVAPEELQSEVAALAERLSKAATLALGLIKDSVNRGLDLPLEEALKVEARNFARTALSEDAVTGVMAFLQKQEPEFKGR